MLKSVAKVLVPGMLLAASVLVAPVSAQATTSPRTTDDCIDYAVDHGVNESLAFFACDAPTFDECYWTFRDNYVPATVAYHACKLK
ncbi:hypothetical protein LZ318_17815 [Saccharopolyspora indica]|uniref:hypothetical protein n=1 Tax=Saccharopolyspora indica TaxID=1229659 RepID=UPI0022EAC680|nr:hypothetical protein [Saccharopolyspora indica]MDA3648297.1 hypothetical protein [Saccharopolyspora indica]